MKSGSADTVIIPIALKDHAYRYERHMEVEADVFTHRKRLKTHITSSMDRASRMGKKKNIMFKKTTKEPMTK